MKYVKNYKVFESMESVESICRKYDIQNWTLNDDGSIDVDGDVNLSGKELTKLPLKFGKVNGFFNCIHNRLTSLEGSPTWVGGYFNCSYNDLTNLVGGPNFVDVYFSCSVNKLTNLEGCPEKIFGNLYCQNNKIITLDYYPTILTGGLYTWTNPINEIWSNVIQHKSDKHDILLELFWLNNPIRFEGGEWVCYREFLDNFFDEIGVPKPPKLKNYKEI